MSWEIFGIGSIHCNGEKAVIILLARVFVWLSFARVATLTRGPRPMRVWVAAGHFLARRSDSQKKEHRTFICYNIYKENMAPQIKTLRPTLGG